MVLPLVLYSREMCSPVNIFHGVQLKSEMQVDKTAEIINITDESYNQRSPGRQTHHRSAHAGN